jgi:leader peptidase (prepilin peptidase)/N-methyltransferase
VDRRPDTGAGVPVTSKDRVIAVAGALGGVALGVVGWHAVAVLAVVSGVGVGVCRVDVRQRRIPTPLVAIAAVGVLAVAITTMVRDESSVPLARAAVGAVVLGATFLVVHLASPAGIGFGDVRLATVIGAAANLATATWTVALLVGLGAAVAAVAAMAITRQRSVPFGPFLVAAAIAVCLATVAGGSW